MEDLEEQPERYDKFKSAEGTHNVFKEFSFANLSNSILTSPSKRRRQDSDISERSEKTPDSREFGKSKCTNGPPGSINTRLQKIKEGFTKQQNELEVNSLSVTSTLKINNVSPDCNSVQFRSNVSFSPTLISTEINIPIQTYKTKSNGNSPFMPNDSKVQTTPLKSTDINSLMNQTGKPSNFYKNLKHWSVPTGSNLKKNVAQTRLQKLKSFVLSSKSTPNSPNVHSSTSPDSLNRPEGSSPLIENVNKNLNKPEDNSHNSPLLAVSQKKLNSPQNGSHRPSSLNIIKKSPNKPEDTCYRSPLLKAVKRNLSDADLEFNPPRKIPRDAQHSQQPPKNETVTSNDAQVGTPGKPWKDNSESVAAQECSKSYKEKMERTAVWILNSPTTENKPVATEDTVKSSSVWEDFENSTIEEMEWTNAEPDEDIKASTSSKKKDAANNQSTDKLKDLCIVVDTNIFISNLSKLQDLINMKVQVPAQPVLYIPWMVMTELDFMKDSNKNKKLKDNIMASIKFINKHLKLKNPRLLGQTTEAAQKQPYIGPSQDDKIVSCCLQASERYETVILLSNDLNLINKACINGIKACSVHEILLKVVSKLANNTKMQKILRLMSMLCSTIICECAKETYGDVYNKMDMLSSAPWSLYECLKRFHRYWETIFKDRMMKQVTKTATELMAILKKNKYISDDSEEYTNVVKHCIHLCIFLKDMEDFRGPVDNTLSDIQKLG